MKRFLVALVVAGFSASPAGGAEHREAVGARSIALAGAYAAVANDGYSLYWNPAGIARIGHHEVTGTYSRLFGLDITNSYVAYIYPVTRRLAVGLDWFNLGYEDSELGYGLNKFNLGIGANVFKNFSLGGALRFLNTSTDFDGRSIGKGSGWSVDFGAQFSPAPNLALGLVANDLSNGEIQYDNGSKAQLYDREIELGFAYQFRRFAFFSLDIGDHIQVGGEYLYAQKLALRLGCQRELRKDRETLWSFGTGIKIDPMQFDIAYVMYPYLDNTTYLTLSSYFNFGRTMLDIENVTTTSRLGLFPSKWQKYESSPFLSFDVRNGYNAPLSCSWKVELKDLIGRSTTGEITLRPGEIKTIAAVGHFTEEFYANESDAVKSGKIQVIARHGKKQISESANFDAFVYSQSAIDWSDGTEQIAGFINPSDATVRENAALLMTSVGGEISSENPLNNVLRAAILFEGMEVMGISYVPDPNRPYGAGSEAIDDIQSPSRLLETKVGDCDDLSALYSAMLESVGIHTAILDVPGHIFLMFDSGVPLAYLKSILLDPELLIEFDGRIFVPVEVTSLGQGFIHSCIEGARQYRRWKELGKAHEFLISEAWKEWPPIPRTSKSRKVAVDREEFGRRVRSEFTNIEAMRTQSLRRQFLGPIQSNLVPADSLNLLAVSSIITGDTETGKKFLDSAITLDSGNPDLKQNLANALCLLGDFGGALSLLSALMEDQIQSRFLAHNFLIATIARVEADRESSGVDCSSLIRDAYDRYPQRMSRFADIESLSDCCVVPFSHRDFSVTRCIYSKLSDLSDPLTETITRGAPTTGSKLDGKWFKWYGLDWRKK